MFKSPTFHLPPPSFVPLPERPVLLAPLLENLPDLSAATQAAQDGLGQAQGALGGAQDQAEGAINGAKDQAQATFDQAKAQAKEALTGAVSDAYKALNLDSKLPPELNNPQLNQQVIQALSDGSVSKSEVKGILSTALGIAGAAGGAALCAAAPPLAPLCAAAGSVIAKSLVSIADGAHSTVYAPADPNNLEYSALANFIGDVHVAENGGEQAAFVVPGSADYNALVQLRDTTINQALSMFSSDTDSSDHLVEIIDRYFAPEASIEQFRARLSDTRYVPYLNDCKAFGSKGSKPCTQRVVRPRPDKGGSFDVQDTYEWSPVRDMGPYYLGYYTQEAYDIENVEYGFGFMLPFVPPEIILGLQTWAVTWDGVSWVPGVNQWDPGHAQTTETCVDRCDAFPYGAGDRPSLWVNRYYDNIVAILAKWNISFGPQAQQLKQKAAQNLTDKSYWLQRLQIYKDFSAALFEVLRKDMSARLDRGLTAAALKAKVALVDAQDNLTDQLAERTGCNDDACRQTLRSQAVSYMQRSLDDGPEVVAAQIEKDHPYTGTHDDQDDDKKGLGFFGWLLLGTGAVAATTAGYRVFHKQPAVPPSWRHPLSGTPLGSR